MRSEYGTQIAIAVGLVGILIFLLVSAKFLLLTNYKGIEAQQTREHLRRVVGAIDSEIAGLAATTADYATWDETWNYLADGHPGYVADNFSVPSLSRLRIDVVAILRIDGSLMYGQLLQGTPQHATPLPAEISFAFAPGSAVARRIAAKGRASGIILAGGRPLAVAAKPVLSSQGEGPVRGYLLMGRFVGERETTWLANLTRLPLAVVTYDRRLLDTPAFAGTSRFTAESSQHLFYPDEQHLEGYALISDLDEQPAFVVKLALPRLIYAEGRKIIGYFVMWSVVIVLLAAGISLLLLKRLAGVQRQRTLAEALNKVVALYSPKAILLLDIEAARIMETTAEVSTLLGIPPPQLTGLLFRELITDGRDPFEECRRRITRQESSGSNCMLGLRRADNQTVAVAATLSLIYIEQETVIALLLTPDPQLVIT